MNDARRARLERLTGRWRARHDSRMASGDRPRADIEREAKASAFFPWRTESPGQYAARYGAAMSGYTYDAYTYADAKLEAWLRELGELLRSRGRR